MNRVFIRGALKYAAIPVITAVATAVVLLATDFWRPQTPEVVIRETHANPFDGRYVVHLEASYEDGSECECTFKWAGTQEYFQAFDGYSAFLEAGETVTVSVTANKYARGGRPSHSSLTITAPAPGDETIHINKSSAFVMPRNEGDWLATLELGISSACQNYTVTWWDHEGNELEVHGVGTFFQYGVMEITEHGSYLTSYEVTGCAQSLSGTLLVNTKSLEETS